MAVTTRITKRAIHSARALELLPPPDYSHLKPLPDPPREPDMLQDDILFYFKGALKIYYAGLGVIVLIVGQGYLRREPYNADERFAPDCVVVFGVNPKNIIVRNGYVINEVGKPPDFVLEVASESTGRRDYTVKREGYARYGVGEYWRFDPSGGRFHDAPLAGDILVDGEYQPFPIHREEDGLIWGHSPLLGLDMCWDDGELRVREPGADEFLPTPEEVVEERNQARFQAQQAERRALEAEAENARLRELLRRRNGG